MSHARQKTSRRRLGRVAVKGAIAAALAAVFVGAGASAALAVDSTVPVEPNPARFETCPADVAISIDLSNSVTDAQLQRTREELAGLARALEGYPVNVAIHTFASNAPASNSAANAPFPLTPLTAAGVEALVDHVNGLERPASADGGTNWDRALAEIAESDEHYDSLLFVTDGNPTQYGSPAAGPGSSTDVASIDAAVTSANALKLADTRVVPIGFSDNVSGDQLAQLRSHLAQISGPTEGQDYHITGFSRLERLLVGIINANCGGIELTKVGELALGATGAPGDAVQYTFRTTNTGVVPLTDVTIADPKPGVSTITYGAWPGTPGTLAPGEFVDATATYQLTVADVIAGSVSNTANTSGILPTGDVKRDEAPAVVELPAQAPAISLEKNGVIDGSTIEYSFTVTNTGNTQLAGVGITDELAGLSAIEFGTWPDVEGVLTPGQSVTATASYELSQADLDAGSVLNTATATGTSPTGTVVTDDDDHDERFDLTSAIDVVKTGVLNGDTISYGFTATNTGDVTLTDVALADELEGLSAITYGDWPAAAGVLAPGESVTATATYELTAADRSAGSVLNVVTVTGLTPQDEQVSDDDSVTVAVETPAAVVTPDAPTAPAAPAAPVAGALAITGLDAGQLSAVSVLAALAVALGGLFLARRRVSSVE